MPQLRQLVVVLAILSLLVDPSFAQRPLIMNHTFSSLPMSQHPSFNSWPSASGGKQLRNGRLHEQPLPLPQHTLPVATQYEDYEAAPPGSRRDNKRRLAQMAQRPGSGNGGRRGMESLRKELMNPSVGGPGGGISGGGSGYPSYSATSSIGRIDGLGQGLGSADRYGALYDQLRQPSGMAAMTAGPLGGPYSTRFPPLYAGVDDQPKRSNRKNSISELYKLKKALNQADEPAGGVTHGNFEGDPQPSSADPLQEIKDRIRDTSPNAVSYF